MGKGTRRRADAQLGSGAQKLQPLMTIVMIPTVQSSSGLYGTVWCELGLFVQAAE